MMLFLQSSTFQIVVSTILADVPWEHWVFIGVLTLVAFFLIRKKCSVYGAVAMGITVFIGLSLLDLAVVIRLGNELSKDIGFDLAAEYNRLVHAGELRRVEMLCNVAAFVPFGFFLSEFFSSTKRFRFWRQIGYVTFIGFGLSLCIECLQWILRVGIFELTDLVLNTAGICFGAGLSLIGRKVLGFDKH